MATIKDVAERAQVAKSTVSYAFNKPHKVNAATLERIMKAARELNYRPNMFAQGLAGGKTQMVGLLVPDIRYPFNATVARGIEDKLRQEGYLAITASTDGDSEQTIQLLGQLHRRGVSGFIIVPSFFGISTELEKALFALSASSVPIVIAGYKTDDERIDQVSFQPQAAARRIVSYLIKLGHRNIAYIGAKHTQASALTRYFGYQESLVQHGIAIRPELTIETDVTRAQAKKAIEKLLALPNPPTAVFAINDVVAYAVLDYCQQHRINIPEELSLVTFDYQAAVQREIPSITSIIVPVYEVGCVSAELLLNRFGNPDTSHQHRVLAYKFAARDTAAAPIATSGHPATQATSAD